MNDITSKNKTAIVLHAINAAFVVFSATAMFTGFNFMGTEGTLSLPGLSALRFFTVLSNVLAGTVSLAMLCALILMQKKKITELPKWLHILNMAATTGVTLTMMVTIFFLAPTATYNFLLLFTNSNLFMHLLTPLLSIIAFSFFEPGTKIRFSETSWGTVPMLLYSLFYVPNVIFHLKDGMPDPAYDWYGFFVAGINSAWIVLPVILVITWAFSIGLWALNRKCSK